MKTILLIEENNMMRLFLVNLFSRYFDIHAVAHVKGAVDYLQSEIPDMIISEIQPSLEAFNSVGNANLLRQSIPWMVLTGKDAAEERINAFKQGAKDCISKPFNPEELLIRAKLILNSEYIGSIRTVA